MSILSSTASFSVKTYELIKSTNSIQALLHEASVTRGSYMEMLPAGEKASPARLGLVAHSEFD